LISPSRHVPSPQELHAELVCPFPTSVHVLCTALLHGSLAHKNVDSEARHTTLAHLLHVVKQLCSEIRGVPDSLEPTPSKVQSVLRVNRKARPAAHHLWRCTAHTKVLRGNGIRSDNGIRIAVQLSVYCRYLESRQGEIKRGAVGKRGKSTDASPPQSRRSIKTTHTHGK